MGNRVFRIILGIVLAIAALVAIYIFLPGSAKNPMTEFFQKTFQKDTYAVAEYYQKQEVPKREIKFGEMMANCGGSSAWVVENLQESEDGTTGIYTVHAYAYKVDVSMEHENGQENALSYSQAEVEVRFEVEKKAKDTYITTSYSVFVNEDPMNDFYKEQALDNLAGKAKANIANEKERQKRDAATSEAK